MYTTVHMIGYLLHKKRLKNQNTYSSLFLFARRETSNGVKKLGRWETGWEGNFKLCIFLFFCFFSYINILPIQLSIFTVFLSVRHTL